MILQWESQRSAGAETLNHYATSAERTYIVFHDAASQQWISAVQERWKQTNIAQAATAEEAKAHCQNHENTAT